MKLDHGDVAWWDSVGLATYGSKLVIAGGGGFATARLFDNVSRPLRDPLPGTKQRVSMTGATAPSKSLQPSARPRDVFSAERIDALQTL